MSDFTEDEISALKSLARNPPGIDEVKLDEGIRRQARNILWRLGIGNIIAIVTLVAGSFAYFVWHLPGEVARILAEQNAQVERFFGHAVDTAAQTIDEAAVAREEAIEAKDAATRVKGEVTKLQDAADEVGKQINERIAQLAEAQSLISESPFGNPAQ